ncbi:proline--tRNA ligase [Campylobacter sp. RM12651]|uniref:proline--tRNA ligase n=1 Tax=Campylobacter sp. RM12651 TaxID=1660079 RepID=UPI001EFA6980|nr:proline--tRNA ligase [Campylobacter sp. RM12651]ULO03323.1 prolyl-tRNA synthetase [Campylobacter sp. RM12651]
MRFSKLYAPTTKEAPRDAILKSHILLSRAAYIEQLGSGLYSYLPLGLEVLENIKNIVIKHMKNAGANYLNLSFVCPLNYWDESGRSAKFGKELLRFKDRKENDFILSPTAEEAIVALVRGKITSYKQLPINLFQIQTKFRDEARPRFGLFRAREFIMKDAYSFHDSLESLEAEFLNMQEAYCKIFDELGLNYAIVEADSGAIGGSGSREFMVISPSGEDDLAICECGYCANIETAKRAKRKFIKEIEADFAKFHTPNVKTIEDLAKFFKCKEHNFIKAVAKKAIYVDKEEIIVYFIRGCDELNETKALNAANALDLVDASEEELIKANLVPGFIGLKDCPVRFFIDSELENESDLICGANEKDYHYVGFKVTSFLQERFYDLSLVKENDECHKCNKALKITKGIEVGHIFKLGDKYSSAMNATYLDNNGKAKPFIMGCYGIGISRLLAVIAECNNDDYGLIFDKNISAFTLQIIISDIKNEEQIKFANDIYEYCLANGIKVLLDDRNERFGVKMSDYELIGTPYAIVVGKKLDDNLVEFRARKTLEKLELNSNEVKDKLSNLLK